MSGGIGKTESKSVVRRARHRRETHPAPSEPNARASADAETEERR